MKEQYDFNGFSYIKDYNSLEGTTIRHQKTPPKEIYKFYSLSKFSVDALLKGYFYASHPIELNDTFDSTKFLMYASEKIDIIFYEKLIQGAISKNEIRELYDKDTKNPEHFCRWYIDNHYDVSTNLFGIISTTAKENNILMWPHYTQEMGFQISFNTNVLENSIRANLNEQEEYLGFFPINYCKKLYPIDISKYNTMFVPIYYVTNVKLETWQYEEEWRFMIGKQNMGVPYSKAGLVQKKDYFVHKENRYVYYDKNIISEITVASNFFNGRNFEIEWIDDQNVKVAPRAIDTNWEYNNQVLFLDYISENFNDKFYHCGRKYEIVDGEFILIRTKEKMLIKRESEGVYILTRTQNFKKFIE